MTTETLQRIADGFEREANDSYRRGRTEAAEALSSARAVILEVIADAEEKGRLARIGTHIFRRAGAGEQLP